MVEFRTLGSLELKDTEGQELRSVLAQPKRVALLAYLAVATPRGFHRRDKLLALFWPELDDQHARHSLNQAVYALRGALGEDVLVSRGDEEVGLNDDAFSSDVRAFESALDTGRADEALKLYEEAIQRDPKRSAAMARAHARQVLAFRAQQGDGQP